MAALTKEEKDKLVDQRMEIMKEKNEKRRQRQKEIEDEQRAMGDAAAPPTYIYEPSGWREPEPQQAEDVPHSGNTRSAQWPGEKPQGKEHDRSNSRGHMRGGRGGRGGRRDAHNQFSPPANSHPINPPVSPTSENWDTEARSPPSNIEQGKAESKEAQTTLSPITRGRGRGTRIGSGRLGGRGGHGDHGEAVNRKEMAGRGSQGRGADVSYESTRKQNYAAYEDELQSHGGGRANTFLNDGFRDDPKAGEKTNAEIRGEGENRINRHPRNYGGGGQVDLKDKTRLRRDFNPEVNMTGKERHEHHKWKEERAICDQKRLERAQKGGGQWARPWDDGKGTSNEAELPAEYGIYKDSESKRLVKRVGSGRFAVDPGSRRQAKFRSGSVESPAMRGVTKGGSSRVKSIGRGRAKNLKSHQGDSGESHREVKRMDSDVKVTIHSGTDTSQASNSSAITSPHPNSHPPSPNQKYQQSSNKPSQSPHSRAANQRPHHYNASSHDGEQRRDTYNRQISSGKRGGERRGGEVRGGAKGDGERKDEPRPSERRAQSSYAGSSEAQPGGRSDKGNRKSGGGINQSSNKNTRVSSGVSPKPQQHNQSSPNTKSTQAKATSAKHTGKVEQVDWKTKDDSEEQEVIITDEDDEDGWVDIDTDEDFTEEEEEEETPRPSKEPTPARSNLSKESTPVPHSTSQNPASIATPPAANANAPVTDTVTPMTPEKGVSAAVSDLALPATTGTTEDGKATDTLTTTGCAKEETKAPVKAKLHIDIRDPVDEEEEVADFLKTPEGGPQKIDWAAEMEAESPASTPNPGQDKVAP
ncbi:coiled-coil domain-containing protein 9-like isoform X2 [Watersipora subatra]|uniref:coiled-coil domain-containing protein 9-like isoform X2 n=1 Tax=Watersipora subatra TaxID=2589382 RepID=UPI00355AF33C